MRKSRDRHSDFRGASLSAAEQRHSLLLLMAADLKRLREQGERIQELRLAKQAREGRRITQETAAAEIGAVTIRQYRTWEKPGADMKFENLKALAEYYEVTTDYIQYGAGHSPGAVSAPPKNGPKPDDRSQLERMEMRLEAVDEVVQRLDQRLNDIDAAFGVLVSERMLVAGTKRDIDALRQQLGGGN